MKHVLVHALTEDLPKISLALAEVGAFAPGKCVVDKLPTIPGKSYRDLFRQAQTRLDKLGPLLKLDPLPALASVRVVEETELARLNDWLGTVWATASSYEEQFRRLVEQERLVDQREISLGNFADLNVDLGMLQGTKQFLNLFIGTVPQGNIQRLEEALRLANHFLYTFLRMQSTVNVVIVGPRREKPGEEQALQSVLQSADFTPIPIPQELASQPEVIRQEISTRRAAIAQERDGLQEQLQGWIDSLRSELDDVRRTLVMAEPYVRLDSAMRSAGQLGAVTGWVPEDSIGKLEETLNQRVENPFLISVRDPLPDERRKVPTMVRPSALFAPFQDIVHQYGIPRYGEIDPTPFFSVTFLFMFGMMFGDVGHGGVIVLFGLIFYRQLGHFSRLVIPVGLSAMAFGFLFGSVFGYEDVIIHHLWMSPIHNTPYTLAIGLMWGIAFIVLATSMSIYNHILQGEHMEAIFGHHGIISVALFLAVVWGLIQTAQGGSFGIIPTIIAVTAIATISAYAWVEMSQPAFEKAMVVIIGIMEIFMSYTSNTLSFLRVAAFSLNHAALALAVFAIANALDTTGHWLTVVLGNVFILVLEGAIVCIQTLRLEYYEGFSRYYAGDGNEFRPIEFSTRVAE
jgi:V/A-type H+-transporting ATPase subunit I